MNPRYREGWELEKNCLKILEYGEIENNLELQPGYSECGSAQ